MCEKVMGHFANINMSVVVVKCLYLGCVVQDRTSVFSLYRNPDLDDQIYDCLLTSTAAAYRQRMCEPRTCS